MYVCMYVYAHVSIGPLRVQRRVLGLLELEFQAVLSYAV